MAWEYSEKTKQLFMDAVSNSEKAHIGELENPDAEGFHGSLVCGDALKLTFNVEKNKDPEKDKISTVKYLTFGCTSAIAASEALCIMLETGNYTPITALSITKDDIVCFLNGLPTQKIHCSIMGVEALHSAVFNWAEKRNVDLSKHGYSKTMLRGTSEKPEDNRVVCQCMEMTKGYISDQIKDLGLKTVEDVVNVIKAGSVCGNCIEAEGGIRDILKEIIGTKENNITEKELTPYQISKQIEKVVNSDIVPVLERDGGGLEIVDIKGYDLYFRLRGTCTNCSAASNTIEYTIQKTLRDKINERIRAINVY